MDKLSEYLPLLIILVAFITSVVGKKKKPGKITEKTTLPGTTVEEAVDEGKPQFPYTEVYQKVEETKSKKPVNRRLEIQSGKKVALSAQSPIVLEVEETEDSSFSFEEDDIKKAIIYTEIINKKEW